jgi:transposase
MSIIQQGSLFELQDILEWSRKDRFSTVFDGINIMPIIKVVSKKAYYGRPTKLNYHAMAYSLMARILERIPTIKDLIRRLENDPLFLLDCGFTFSDDIPSEASYSRFIRKIKDSNVLDQMNHDLVLQAIAEGFIQDEHVAIDGTHIEARDRYIPDQEEVLEETPPKPKKRGRKKKEDLEAWKKEQKEIEQNLPLFEKKLEKQLDYSFDELRSEMPIEPRWGVKKNSEGKNLAWFGYKGHLAVGTKSQYILLPLFSSGNMNDSKAAIPLLKGVTNLYPMLNIKKILADAGYDYMPIYQQINRMNADANIAYNKKNESPLDGFDEYFAPTCEREHSYRYDSYNPKYETLKYTRPKECKECPLQHDGLCQKTFKIKKSSDIRRYTFPARGSESWKLLAKERSSVERVNAYLKEYFQLNNVRYCSGELAKTHFDLSCLLFNGSKLAIDRLNKKLQSKAA